MYKILMRQKACVKDYDENENCLVTLIDELPCSYPFPHSYRQNRADTAYDFQPLFVYTHVPDKDDFPIKENMRLIFEEDDEADFRIHSIAKWPLVRPEYLEIILQGDGHG